MSQRPTNRLYALEGGVHFYSSPPCVLTPADLYEAKSKPTISKIFDDCNIYVIAIRRRIFIDPRDFILLEKHLRGNFLVQRSNGLEKIPFRWQIPEPYNQTPHLDVVVAPSGTNVCISTEKQSLSIAAHVIVSTAESEVSVEERDLQVLYIGQGIGRSKRRSAIDRLLNHSTLQRILAEVHTHYPEAEIQLLLYRFECRRTYLSNGGDFNADPKASVDEECAHIDRMNNVQLTRKEKVALVEAALIRHFQPCFNVQLKKCDFSARQKISILEKLLKKDVTGLIVEICTANINSRLTSADMQPLELTDFFDADALTGKRLSSDEERQKWFIQLHCIAHTHYAHFPLTTSDERDTFMHGMIWNGSDERMEFMGAKSNYSRS